MGYEKMDLKKIKGLFIELESYLKKYGDNSILPCIWDNDLETRKNLNLPFEKIHNELWDSLKNIIC